MEFKNTIFFLAISVFVNILLSVLLIFSFNGFFSEPQNKNNGEVETKMVTVTTTVKEFLNKDRLIIVSSTPYSNKTSNDAWLIRTYGGESNVVSSTRALSNREATVQDTDDVFTADVKDCPDFNHDAPDSFVTFENDELRIKLPFNERWGTDFKKVNPYSVWPGEYNGYEARIDFGSVYVHPEGWEGNCDAVRGDTYLLVGKPKTIETYLAELNLDPSYYDSLRVQSVPSLEDPSKILTILGYTDDHSMVDGTVSVFFGDKHTYIFNSLSFDFDVLSDIIRSAEWKK